MAAHHPPPDDFMPWADRLLNWWRNRRLQREFRAEIDRTNGFELYRNLFDYGPKHPIDKDEDDPDV